MPMNNNMNMNNMNGPTSNNGDNGEDEVQKQIDEKLKEHQMLENDGRFTKDEPQIKLYDLNDPNQAYVGDRHLLIKKISQLDTL